MIFILSQKNKCTSQKSEARFFSRTCQEANAMFIVLFRPFLGGGRTRANSVCFTNSAV